MDSPVPCESVRETTYRHNRHFGGYFDHDALVSTEKALERYDRDGIQLIFTDDHQTPWGPGWLYDRGLEYTKVNETHTNVTSTSLISPVAFKTHYCDLMTPYRALEWIYIGGVKHGPIEY